MKTNHFHIAVSLLLGVAVFIISVNLLRNPSSVFTASTPTQLAQVSSSGTSCSVVCSGLVGYWPFDDGSGTTAVAAPVSSTPAISTTGTGPNLAGLPSFTRTLSLGSAGSDVKNLQIFLNDYGFSVAQSGNGSKGHETSYFGPATKAALIRFQDVYAAEILKPEGLTEGTGYFGVGTMKEINTIIR